MTLLETITQIHANKQAQCRAPTHALLHEVIRLTGRTKHELSLEAAELIKQGKIKVGDTINDKYLKLIRY